MKTNRRSFIKKSAYLSVGTLMVPQLIQAYNPIEKTGKRLVVIQLSGGNDGLNTIVPYRNDLYYQLRPEIAIAKNIVLKGNDDLGFNPVMKGVKSMYDDGDLAVINSVGYPNPDRSHFRSMDIWHTASGSNEYLSHGWLGKHFDQQCDDCKPYQAIEVDDSLSLAMKGKNYKAMSTTNPYQLYMTTRDKQIQRIGQHAHSASHTNLDYLYKTMAQTVDAAAYIRNKSKGQQSGVSYPNTPLGKHLKLTAQLINGGASTEVYYLSMGGFDTHFNQVARQKQLLKQYSEATSAFVKDMKMSGNWNDTLMLTFSEFGRRVAENGSKGTDHGTANNLLLMGGDLKKPGFYNEAPNLTDLDNGDLKFQVDFRSVYSTVLKNWLQSDPKAIIGTNHPVLNIV